MEHEYRGIRERVEVLILSNDKVLMVKVPCRDKYLFIFPGGGVEAGESIYTAAERECMEEVGIVIRNAGIIKNKELFVDWRAWCSPSRITRTRLKHYYGTKTRYVLANFKKFDFSIREEISKRFEIDFFTIPDAIYELQYNLSFIDSYNSNMVEILKYRLQVLQSISQLT